VSAGDRFAAAVARMVATAPIHALAMQRLTEASLLVDDGMTEAEMTAQVTPMMNALVDAADLFTEMASALRLAAKELPSVT
jgi:hypothetical protein